jgi:2-(3-amino-3-carboxypropyl)histidine synthase
MHQLISMILKSQKKENRLFLLYRYDPYSKEFTREYYDIKSMHKIRQNEINKAANGQVWGLVLGSLGRQGSPKVLQVEFTLNLNKYFSPDFIDN